MIRTCEFCGCEIKKGDYFDNSAKHHFCGRDCYFSFRKGKSFEEFYGEEKAIELKILHSESWKGENNPNFGGLLPETKEKLRQINMGKHCSEDTRQKMSKSHIGLCVGSDNPMFGRIGERSGNWKGGRIERICKTCGKHFNVDPNVVRRGKGIFCSRSCIHPHYFRQLPTTPEKIFQGFCENYHLPFQYVGNGKFWIENINPDFIECNGHKLAVEIFGNYWHSLLNPSFKESNTEEYRRKILSKYGWELVVFWESELESKDAENIVLSRLRDYLDRIDLLKSNHSKLVEMGKKARLKAEQYTWNRAIEELKKVI